MAGRQNKDARTFGAPLGNPPPAPTTGRRPGDPQVGPADPATRRRMMREHEAAGREETRTRAAEQNAESRSEGERTRQPRPDNTENPTRDLSAEGAGRRISGRQRQIDEAVEEQARGRKPAD